MMWHDVFWVAGGLIAVAGAWTKAIKPFLRFLHRMVNQIDEVAAAMPTLLDIASEFQPNNGSTLRDQIDLIKLDMTELKSQVEQVIARDRTARTRNTDVTHPA